jgi:hypothetical protein
MKKEDNFISSPVLREYYNTAIEKGWISNEVAVKTASLEADRYSPTGNLMQDLVNLAFGLREAGLYSQAESLETKINIFKKAQIELGLIDQKSLLMQQHAHPENAKIVDAQNGWGVVHTNVDRQRKILETLTHQPKGMHQEAIKTISLAAAEALGLLKLAQDDGDGLVESSPGDALGEDGEDMDETVPESGQILPSGKLVDPAMAQKVSAHKNITKTTYASIKNSLKAINGAFSKIKNNTKLFSKDSILKNMESPTSKWYLSVIGADSESLKNLERLTSNFGTTPESAAAKIEAMEYESLKSLITSAMPAYGGYVIGTNFSYPMMAAPGAKRVRSRQERKEKAERGFFDKIFDSETKSEEVAKDTTPEEMKLDIVEKAKYDDRYKQNKNSIWSGIMSYADRPKLGGIEQSPEKVARLANAISQHISSESEKLFSEDNIQAAGAAAIAKYSTVVNTLNKISTQINVGLNAIYPDRVELFTSITKRSAALSRYLNDQKDELIPVSSLGLFQEILGNVAAINASALNAVSVFETNPISTELESPRVSSKKAKPILDNLVYCINMMDQYADYLRVKAPNGPDYKKVTNYYNKMMAIHQAVNANQNKTWADVQAAIAGKAGLSFESYDHLNSYIANLRNRVAQAVAQSPGLGVKASDDNQVVKLGQSMLEEAVSNVKGTIGNLFGGIPAAAGPVATPAAAAAAIGAVGAIGEPLTPEPKKVDSSVKTPDVAAFNPAPSGGVAAGGGAAGAGSGGVSSGKGPSAPATSKDKLSAARQKVWEMQEMLQELSEFLTKNPSKAPEANKADFDTIMFVGRSNQKGSLDGDWGRRTTSSITAANKATKLSLTPSPSNKADESVLSNEATKNTQAIQNWLDNNGWTRAGERPAVELDRISMAIFDYTSEATAQQDPNGTPLKDKDLSSLYAFYKYLEKFVSELSILPKDQWFLIFSWFNGRVEALLGSEQIPAGKKPIFNTYKNYISNLNLKFNQLIDAYKITEGQVLGEDFFKLDSGAGGGGIPIGQSGVPGQGGPDGGWGPGGQVGPGGKGFQYGTIEEGEGDVDLDEPPFGPNGINLNSPHFDGFELGFKKKFPISYFKYRAVDVARTLFAKNHRYTESTRELTLKCVDDYSIFLSNLQVAVSAALDSYREKANPPDEVFEIVYKNSVTIGRMISSHLSQLTDVARQMAAGRTL